MQLVRPSLEYLQGYVAALKRSGSPDHITGADAARDELAQPPKSNTIAFLAVTQQ